MSQRVWAPVSCGVPEGRDSLYRRKVRDATGRPSGVRMLVKSRPDSEVIPVSSITTYDHQTYTILLFPVCFAQLVHGNILTYALALNAPL